VLEAFVKPEEGHLQLLVRVPLVLLEGLALPKRGPGYLDLARIDDRLREAATAVGRQIELFEDGTRLSPTPKEVRISLLSDQSFRSYADALAHLQGARLPLTTDLFWNQGFFDARLEYPIQSARSNFSVRTNVAPELGRRLRLQLQFLPASGVVRTYELQGRSGAVPLDPRWHEAAWIFIKSGVVDSFAVDRLAFLVCLIAPFRRFRSLLAVVMVLAGLQAATLTVGAWGAVSDAHWLPPLLDTCFGIAIVLLAIENVVAPSLRRRWFVSALIGALSGFGLAHVLADHWQFAGAHPVLSLVSFNLGIALGEVIALALLFVVLGVLFTHVLGTRAGMIVLSLILGNVGWHWMTEGAHRLEHAVSAGFPSASTVAWWVALAVVVGAAARFLPSQFGGPPIPPPLSEPLGRGNRE
jgi:hypothetical protein